MDVHQDLWDAVFKKNAEIVSRKIAGETILVPIRGKLADMQNIFALNPVAEHIWGQLDGLKTLREISDSIPSAFSVDRQQADADAIEFIRELIKAGLVSEVR